MHPEPPIQDVLMIFQHDSELSEEDVTIYKDYGLTERLPQTQIPDNVEDYVEEQNTKIDQVESHLNSTEIDITSPLSAVEWKLWYDLVVATKGHGFLQILPVGYRANQPFKTNLLQVLPKKAKAWGNFEPPIDSLISLREEFYIKENRRLFEQKQNKPKEKEKEAKTKDSISEAEKKFREEQQLEEDQKNEHIYKFSKENILRIPEYDFPHAVCMLDSKPSENSLLTDFMKMSDELDLGAFKDLGLTILLHEKWMFVTTVSKPYTKMENDLDLFVDAFSYGGIMNIHIKKHSWPQTAGIDIEDNILDFLPSREYSEPQPSQIPEKEEPLEEEESEAEVDQIEEKEGEGEGDRPDDN